MLKHVPWPDKVALCVGLISQSAPPLPSIIRSDIGSMFAHGRVFRLSFAAAQARKALLAPTPRYLVFGLLRTGIVG
jgi:hypothetical protein